MESRLQTIAIKDGSHGAVRVLTSLMILIAIQLLPPSTNKSKSLGARGRKSRGLLQPSSQMTLITAAVTLESSSSSINISLILGHAGRSVSGYINASR